MGVEGRGFVLPLLLWSMYVCVCVVRRGLQLGLSGRFLATGFLGARCGVVVLTWMVLWCLLGGIFLFLWWLRAAGLWEWLADLGYRPGSYAAPEVGLGTWGSGGVLPGNLQLAGRLLPSLAGGLCS